MPGDLERHLGELSGQLSQLMPSLARIEQRQHTGEEKTTRLDERVNDHDRRIASLNSRLNDWIAQTASKKWDVLKILLAGVLGAALTLAARLWQ